MGEGGIGDVEKVRVKCEGCARGRVEAFERRAAEDEGSRRVGQAARSGGGLRMEQAGVDLGWRSAVEGKAERAADRVGGLTSR